MAKKRKTDPYFDETPDGRTYVHKRCETETHVSGGDFDHICDPFWPCTGTYCCGCADFVALDEVRGEDTGERISTYRSRLRGMTPIGIKLWRFGLGLLPGLLPGAILGYLVAIVAHNVPERGLAFTFIGAGVSGLGVYVIGIFILNLIFALDYRRIR